MIEEAINAQEVPEELINVLQQIPKSSVEHLSDRFFRSQKRVECDRIVELVGELGEPAIDDLQSARRPAAVVRSLGHERPRDALRMSEFNRFYQDVLVRQIAYGAAPDRGRTLLELLELLDPLILPEAIDEIGMSLDRTASSSLIAMASAGEAASRPPFVQLKAIESLGRLREAEAVPVLRSIVEEKRLWGRTQHRELRVAAGQALSKIDPRYGSQVMAESGRAADLAMGLSSAPYPWCSSAL